MVARGNHGGKDTDFGIDMYLKWLANKRTSCVTQGTLFNVLWQLAWEGALGENGYMNMNDQAPLLSS